MFRLTTRNRQAAISKARRCLILCASSTVSECTLVICRAILHPTVVFGCRNSWPRISSNRFQPALQLRSRIEFHARWVEQSLVRRRMDSSRGERDVKNGEEGGLSRIVHGRVGPTFY